MTSLREIYGPGHTQAEYLRALAAGYETGWWDDNVHARPLATTTTTPTAARNPTPTSTTPIHDRTETNHFSDQEIEGSADTPPQGT